MKLFLTLLLLSKTLHATETINTIRIEIEGHRYDSLHLGIFLNNAQPKFIQGYSVNGYHWEFLYPDSLYDYITHFTIEVSGIPDTVRHALHFAVILNGDTLRGGGHFFGRRPSSLVKARYLETDGPFELFMRVRRTNESVQGSMIRDHFEILTDDQDLISSVEAMHHAYGFFHPRFTYEENLQRNMEFIKRYPNSRKMVSLLSRSTTEYKSKADLAKLFNLFSEELQQSLQGQIVYRYITRDNTIFKNQILTTWDTDILEPIVQDSSKYNLILFSASWCAPCIRQIPILKEVYQNLGQNLTMTYVSMDDEKTAENWRTKMRTHEISWRSLMALTKERIFAMDDYELPGVPHAILVHPNGMKMEKLNLWEEADRQRLYELVKH